MQLPSPTWDRKEDGMSSNPITGTTEKDGSITINGPTGSKEFKIAMQYMMERTDQVARCLIVNVTAETEEDAIRWSEMNQDEIDNIAREAGALDPYHFDEDHYWYEHEYGDAFVNDRECEGEVIKISD